MNEQMTLKEGMTVFDVNSEKVGKVEYVQFGDEDLQKPGVETASVNRRPDDDSLVEDLAEAIAPPTELPDEVRAHLQRYGYIRIDTPLFSSDRLVALNNIAHTTEDEVHLTVTKDGLIKA